MKLSTCLLLTLLVSIQGAFLAPRVSEAPENPILFKELEYDGPCRRGDDFINNVIKNKTLTAELYKNALANATQTLQRWKKLPQKTLNSKNPGCQHFVRCENNWLRYSFFVSLVESNDLEYHVSFEVKYFPRTGSQEIIRPVMSGYTVHNLWPTYDTPVDVEFFNKTAIPFNLNWTLNNNTFLNEVFDSFMILNGLPSVYYKVNSHVLTGITFSDDRQELRFLFNVTNVLGETYLQPLFSHLCENFYEGSPELGGMKIEICQWSSGTIGQPKYSNKTNPIVADSMITFKNTTEIDESFQEALEELLKDNNIIKSLARTVEEEVNKKFPGESIKVSEGNLKELILFKYDLDYKFVIERKAEGKKTIVAIMSVKLINFRLSVKEINTI